MFLLSYPGGSVEPVTAAEARLACRIDASDLDAEVTALISAAREQAEHITRRCYRLQVRREVLSGWPAERAIVLPAPAASAVAITYRSAAAPDDWAVLATDQYRWGPSGDEVQISLRAAVLAWPDLASADEWPDRVRVDVTAGPSDIATVPACVKRYILASVAAWVDQPGALADARLEANPLFERLLDPERLWA